MSWKCPTCGIENDADIASCHGGCGYVRFGRLILRSASGLELRFNVDTRIGTALLKRCVGEEAKFGSEPQCRVLHSDEQKAWVLVHDRSAVNPTLVNGLAVEEGGTKLTPGSVITIGADKARMVVEIEL